MESTTIERESVASDLLPQDIPMGEIFSDSHFNCRGEVIPSQVIDLAKSIREHGLLQPITIQPYNKVPGKKYRIVIGHQRYAAFQINSAETIPAIIKEGLSEVQARTLNLTENLKRKNLNPLQEAHALLAFKEAGLSPAEIAKEIKMSTGWVKVRFSLLELPDAIQQEVAAGFITQEQIRDLAKLPTEERQYEAVRAIKESKARGEKRALRLKPKQRNILAKKPRERSEQLRMIEHILDRLGPNLGTRALAWSAGEISDMDLFRDLREYAEQIGKTYQIPEGSLPAMPTW